MAVIKLDRSVEPIRFDDSPDSKVYEMDMSASSLRRMVDELEEVKDLDAESDDKEVAEALKRFITSCIGEDGYSDALAYVDPDGKGAEEVNAQMTVLAGGLGGILLDRFSRLADDRLKEYIPDDGEEAI